MPDHSCPMPDRGKLVARPEVLSLKMAILRIKALFLLLLSLIVQLPAAAQAGGEIDFISDTQQPMTVEEILLRPNHNILATKLLLADILKQRPRVLYMLGDVVALASEDHKWVNVDKFLDSCRKNNIAVHGLLGNHDVMWSRKKGEENFQKRFPDHVDTGYLSIVDSIAVILLNSNFKKLTDKEVIKEKEWYEKTLKELSSDPSIVTIIVSCHHAPYSNSLVVGSSTTVQHYFLPAFFQTAKCRLFITGHAHAFEHFQYSGKDFLVIGGGGGLHQPLDTSARKKPDLAFAYKPMFHYLSLQRKGDTLVLTSRFLKPDFSGIESGYSVEIPHR